MTRGIQPGSSAHSDESKSIDRLVSETAQALQPLLPQGTSWAWSKAVTREELASRLGGPLWADRSNLLSGIQPDGGVFWHNRTPVLAFEAKCQGPTGNAIERWFKNYLYLQILTPGCAYVSIFTGEGAASPSAVMLRTLRPLLLSQQRDFNVLYDSGPSVYCYAESPPSAELKDLFSRALRRQISLRTPSQEASGP